MSTDKIETRQNGLCSFFLSFHNNESMRIGLFFKTSVDIILEVTTTELSVCLLVLLSIQRADFRELEGPLL